MPKISALPSLTTADAADEAPIVDTSASTTKKWTLAMLKTYLESLTSWISTAMLVDAAVTPAKLLAGTGSSWAWQDWTPTFTNLSGGTLNEAKYIQIGKTVHYRLAYTLAGAGVSGSVSFTPPVTSVSYTGSPVVGTGRFSDTGTNGFAAFVQWGTTTSFTLITYNVAGTYPITGGLSSTIPFTWANTDIISVTGTYEAA